MALGRGGRGQGRRKASEVERKLGYAEEQGFRGWSADKSEQGDRAWRPAMLVACWERNLLERIAEERTLPLELEELMLELACRWTS